MSRYTNEALQRLDEELSRTAVISEDFKRIIMGWAQRAVTIGYEKGQQDEREKGDS